MVHHFGHTREALGPTIEGWRRHLHPEDRVRVIEGLEAAVARGDESWSDEYRFEQRDGSYAAVLDRGYIQRDAAGHPVRMIGTMIDLTERKAAEAALEEAGRQKDAFLAVLSHELRNPLAPIRSGVQILQRAEPGSPTAARALEIVDRQVDQLAHLVDDLLDVTRISRGKVRLRPERLDLARLSRRVAEDHRDLFAEQGIAFEVRVPDDPLEVTGDVRRLAQVVGNLLQNAAKFTPRGERTTLDLAAEGTDTAVLRVRDTGIGIAPEVLAHLFQPFVQAEATLHRSRSGLGLGLALVKHFVEMHGGVVTVESPGPGGGTTFTVRLPLEGSPGRPEPTAEEATPPLRGVRVLVVDDQADVVESLRDLLRLEGHEVATARSGEEALEVARRFRPEVLFCDLGLPGLDGFGVARAARTDPALEGTFLVALSGYAHPRDIEAARAAGFDRHLAKPADPAAIEGLLREARARSLAAAR